MQKTPREKTAQRMALRRGGRRALMRRGIGMSSMRMSEEMLKVEA